MNKDITSGPEIMSGPEVSPQAESGKEIKGITEKDLRVVVPERDGTVLVLQRNAKDSRTPGPEYGELVPEAKQKARDVAEAYFTELFESLKPEERRDLEVLIIASDAKLRTPEGQNSEHKRGLETAEQVMAGVRAAMQGLGVEEGQLLNTSEFAEFAEPSGPVEFDELEDLAMMRKSPEFVNHLIGKYGAGKEFWKQYETDADQEVREKMDAEGVDQIAWRMRSFLRLITKAAEERHKEHEGKRLLIWAVSHYDSISPFVKKQILGRSAKDYFPVNAGAGLTMKISPEGKVVTELSEQEFQVEI